MRKLLIGLVVSLSFIFLFGSTTFAGAQDVIKLGDMRFATSKPVVGLTIAEIVEKFGPALKIKNESCRVPLIVDGELLGTAKGNQLDYEHVSGDNSAVQRFICTLKGIAVADRLILTGMEESLVSIHRLDTVDLGLAAKIMIGEENMEKFLQRYHDPLIPYRQGLEI